MKKNLIWGILTISALSSTYVTGQTFELDTIYYDKNWKGINNPHFASYYRIIEKEYQPGARNMYRDYFITGEIVGEGEYISLNREDDSKTMRNGECIKYYKSGKINKKAIFLNGLLNGELLILNENGTLIERSMYEAGVRNGLTTKFLDDGNCMQCNFSNNLPIDGYYVVTSKDGLYQKLSYSDNRPIYTTPEKDKFRVKYVNGVCYQYYIHDGLRVTMKCKTVDDYGKYYRISLEITNNSFSPIEFNPTSNVNAILVDKKGKKTNLKVQSSQEYQARIKRTQRWEEALAGFAAGLASISAGYSTSSAYGTINESYYNVTATTYDSNAAYQQQMEISNAMASISDSNFRTRQSRSNGYLEKNTIYPKESVYGYFNILQKKGETLGVDIIIDGSHFKFSWDVGK